MVIFFSSPGKHGKGRIVAFKEFIIRNEWTMWRPEPSLAIIPHIILFCHALYL